MIFKRIFEYAILQARGFQGHKVLNSKKEAKFIRRFSQQREPFIPLSLLDAKYNIRYILLKTDKRMNFVPRSHSTNALRNLWLSTLVNT